MLTSPYAKGLAAVALVGFMAVTGCNNQKDQPPMSTGPVKTDGVHVDSEAGAQPRTEPAPAARTSGTTVRSTEARGEWPTRRSGDGWNCTSMAFPTGDVRTSVVGVEKCAPAQARNGAPFEYDIIVTNLTGNNVDDVVLTEQVNGNFRMTKATPEAQSGAAGAMTWSLGDLRPRDSKTVKVSGTASGDGAINSCCSVSYATVLCATIPVVSPQLRLVKTGPAEVVRCDEIIYNFEVANTGTGSINNVRIADPLPTGLMTIDNKQSIDIAVGPLAAGQSKKYTARVKADKSGKYDNKATASGEGVTAESAVVSTVVRSPALTVDIECPADEVIGREISFKATVKSTGDTACANTTLTLVLPGGATFVRADNNGTSSAGRALWNLGSLAPNDSRTVSVTVRPMSAGALQATATAQCTCGAAVNDSCSVSIQGVPDIGISLRDDTGVRLVGDNHVFTYTVKNQGQVDLTNVTLTATMSAGLDFVSSTAPTQGRASGKSVTWNLGTLRVGQEITFTITAKGTAAGEQGIGTVTKSDQLQRTSDASEQVNYIER